MTLRESLNIYLDRLSHASVLLGQRSWSAFRLCAFVGLVSASALCAGLAVYKGLPVWVEATVALAALSVFYVLAMSVKVIGGKERLTYYHHQIAFLLSAALLLKLMDQPVLAFLDISILGFGLLMACGRLGCLMVGCCHGKPAPLGITYCAEHAAAGVSRCYVGVRLFPVQAVEAAWVLCVVCVGVALVLRGSAEGAALSWYVVAYALGRFVIEFARGDSDRPYFYGFSEAQWTSLLMVTATLCAGLSGLLVFRLRHVGAVVLIALTMIVVALQRRLRKTWRQRIFPSPVNLQKGGRDLAR